MGYLLLKCLLFSLTIVLGILSSLTDIKRHQIKNSLILSGIAAGLVIYLIFVTFGNLRLRYDFFLNLIIAFTISFGLYLLRIWPPGDAKLFLLFSFLMPFSNSFKIYPSLFLFFNIFIAGGLVILLSLLLNFIFSPRQAIKAMITKKSLRFFSETFIIVFSISWLFWYLLEKLNLNFNFWLMFVLYLIYLSIYKAIYRLKKIPLALGIILITGISLRFLLQRQIFIQPGYLFSSLKYSIFFILVYTIFQGSKDIFMTGRVPVQKLSAYMKVAADLYDKQGNLLLKKDTLLTQENIKELKRIVWDKKVDFQTIPVRRIIPFAPLMLLGAVLSYTNFLVYFSNLIHR